MGASWEEHGGVFKTETVLLDNMTAFEQWKTKLKKTMSALLLKELEKGIKHNISNVIEVVFVSHKELEKGVQSHKGVVKSNKIVQQALKSQKTVMAVYWLNGHKKEIQHTWLTKGKREEITARLQQGVSRDKILNYIREERT